MGTMIKNRQPATGLSSSEEQSERSIPTQANTAAKPNSNLRVRDIAIAVGFGVVGWALCGAVVGIGTQVVSMKTTLIIHAAAVPVIFGSLSVLLFKKFGATNPFQTAIVFLGVVIALDLLIVSLLIEGNFDMFKSVIGTWLPFALIFVTTYVCGAVIVAGRATNESGMIEAFAPADRIKRAYNILSLGYAGLLSPLERKPRMIGLERAAIRPDDNVLEVAVGPGHSFVEILKTVDPAKTVCGVDLSPKMLAQTRRRSEAADLANADLREADARQLMLDLIPLDDMPAVLSEFHRVLKPNGRLVLVNLSKKSADERTWLERLYLSLPMVAVPYLMGGCRPVLMAQPVKDAGFVDVRREFIPHVIPSEVVTAIEPTGQPDH
jgi:demethylmenaquinone methyltransferase/2-methoxy-6-polyprenyl-1,4-benzoquinol methylase